MKGRTAILGEIGGRPVAALMHDGRLEDLLVEPPEDSPAPGTIFRARVLRPMKGQGGVMLDLGGMHGFLRQAKGLREGESLLVQTATHAEPGKAIPVGTRLLFKSRFAIVTPGAPGRNVSRSIRDEDELERLQLIAHEADLEHGLILRSSCEGAPEEEIREDIAEMAALAEAVLADAEGTPECLVEGAGAHALAWRDWPGPDEIDTRPEALEQHGVLEAVEALQSPRVDLPGGATAFIEPTRAFVAVDVNTGADTSPAAALKANLALVRELPRQLRLRGLGGQIIVDFAPSPKKDRRQIEQALRAALRADGIETALAGWTVLGNFELQRKRERLPYGRLV